MKVVKTEDLRTDFLALVQDAIERGRTADNLLIGQPRALRALNLGLEINARGYHVLVSGPSGTGRMTAIRRILKDLPPLQPLQDLVFVNNFQEPERPKLLVLPAGKGQEFRKFVEEIIRDVKNMVKAEQDGKDIADIKDTTEQNLNNEIARELVEFETVTSQNGMRVIQSEREDGEIITDILPIYGNKVLAWEELHGLVQQGKFSQKVFESLREKYIQLSQDLAELLDRIGEKRLLIRRYLDQMTRTHLTKTVKKLFKSYAKKVLNEAESYFREIEADILENIEIFQQTEGETEQLISMRYAVHILVDHSKTQHAPVVFETRCDPFSLLGSIDVKTDPNNEIKAHYTQIRPGALIRAHGGYLVLRLEDLTANRKSWQSFIRCLDTGLVDIPTPQSALGPLPYYLKPQSIPLLVKVILVGPEGSYDYLSSHDPNFLRLFKINAEFDSEMESNTDTIAEYLRFIKSQIDQKNYLPMDAGGMARVVEYGHRITGNRRKISTQFSLISDIITESHHWAMKDGLKSIDANSVKRALNERAYMFSRAEEQIDEEWKQGRLLIDIAGKKIGQTNGLAVIDRGFYRFGRPIRITARATPGKGGIINIEGKAGLSGRIHTKSVLILEGLLRSLFSPHAPFRAHLTLAVEQNYGGIEGDSASTAEACALISALAGVPMRQDIALTGSINQAGEVQAVAGLTEKVEGFFSLCQIRGLAGQGVVIPSSNLDNLILKDAVLEAIEKGTFHIWTIDSLDEALELLSGMRLGEADQQGEYPQGSLGRLVSQRMRSFLHQSVH